MINSFLSLNIPTTNGAGTPTDTSLLGKEKTIVVGGLFKGASLEIQGSTDGVNYYALTTIFSAGRKVVKAATRFMRVFVHSRSTATFNPFCTIGANNGGGSYIDLVVPAGDGVGTTVDISSLGNFTTVTVGGDFKGTTLLLEVSSDGTDFIQIATFNSPGAIRNIEFVANFARIRVTGRDGNTLPFSAQASIGATFDGESGVANGGQTFTDTVGKTPIFVRSTGNDNNDGSSVELAVATIRAGVKLFDFSEKGRNGQYLELSGFTENMVPPDSGGDYYVLPTTHRGAGNIITAQSFENGKQDFLGYPIGFYADPIAVGVSIDITSYTTDPDTGLVVANISGTIVDGAHAGQFLSISPGEFAVIHSNTVNTLTLATNFISTTGITEIYEQSCTLNFSTVFGLTLSHNGPVSFNGIKFTGGILRNYVDAYSYFQFCHFEGFYTDGRGGICSVYASYFDNAVLQLEGTAIELVGCVLQGSTIRSHGSGGNGRNTLSYCILDGCTPYGAGNHENSFDVEVENTLIDNALTDGIHKQSPQQCRISNTKIQNSVGHAVRADVGGGVCRVDTLSGVGNGGYGLFLQNGCQANEIGTCVVTGTSGDVKVGDSPASLWGAAERTDAGETNPQFCRIF